jgi:hypothetical protein
MTYVVPIASAYLPALTISISNPHSSTIEPAFFTPITTIGHLAVGTAQSSANEPTVVSIDCSAINAADTASNKSTE